MSFAFDALFLLLLIYFSTKLLGIFLLSDLMPSFNGLHSFPKIQYQFYPMYSLVFQIGIQDGNVLHLS